MANIPKIAVQRLQQQSTAGTHPDPNLLSAFCESSMPSDARAGILEHIAQCADCREVVFLSSPDQAATLPVPRTAPSNWPTWPVLRWGVSVAAVVVVMAAVTLHRQPRRNAILPATIPVTDAPAEKEKSISAAISEKKQDVTTMAKIVSLPPATKNELAGKQAGDRLESLQKQGSKLAALPAMKAQNSAVAGGSATEERRDQPGKAATLEVAGAAPEAGSVPVESDQVVSGRAKDAAAEPASNLAGRLSGGAAGGMTSAPRPRAPMFSVIAAPRWTLTSDGTLQRSVDFGRSWQTVPVASEGRFRALSASGRDIWVGGTKGALYHSTDAGETWTQIEPVSSGRTLSGDIIGVEFPDSLHGKVTTTDKLTWTTEDGGQTWQTQ